MMSPQPESIKLGYWFHNSLSCFYSILVANVNFLQHISLKHFSSLDKLLCPQINGNRHVTFPIVAVQRKNKTKQTKKAKDSMKQAFLSVFEVSRLDFSKKQLISASLLTGKVVLFDTLPVKEVQMPPPAGFTPTCILEVPQAKVVFSF